MLEVCIPHKGGGKVQEGHPEKQQKFCFLVPTQASVQGSTASETMRNLYRLQSVKKEPMIPIQDPDSNPG